MDRLFCRPAPLAQYGVSVDAVLFHLRFEDVERPVATPHVDREPRGTRGTVGPCGACNFWDDGRLQRVFVHVEEDHRRLFWHSTEAHGKDWPHRGPSTQGVPISIPNRTRLAPSSEQMPLEREESNGPAHFFVEGYFGMTHVMLVNSLLCWSTLCGEVWVDTIRVSSKLQKLPEPQVLESETFAFACETDWSRVLTVSRQLCVFLSLCASSAEAVWTISVVRAPTGRTSVQPFGVVHGSCVCWAEPCLSCAHHFSRVRTSVFSKVVESRVAGLTSASCGMHTLF